MNKRGFFLMALLCLFLLNLISASEPVRDDRYQCQNKISSKEYFSAYYTNAELKILEQGFYRMNITLGSCKDSTDFLIYANYITRNNQSNFNISYQFVLQLNYKDNKTTITNLDNYNEINSTYIKELVLRKINVFEDNKRIIEFIEKFKPTEGTLGISSNDYIILKAEDKFFTIYSSSKDNKVKGYTLPNSMKFDNFPEINRAHEIIKNNYLNGNLSGCLLTGNAPGYTMTNMEYDEDGPWALRIEVLDCKIGNWFKELNLVLYENSTYKLVSLYDPKIKKDTASYFFKILFVLGISLFFLCIFLMYKRKNMV